MSSSWHLSTWWIIKIVLLQSDQRKVFSIGMFKFWCPCHFKIIFKKKNIKFFCRPYTYVVSPRPFCERYFFIKKNIPTAICLEAGILFIQLIFYMKFVLRNKNINTYTKSTKFQIHSSCDFGSYLWPQYLPDYKHKNRYWHFSCNKIIDNIIF